MNTGAVRAFLILVIAMIVESIGLAATDPNELYHQAYGLEQQGQFEQAVSLYQQLIRQFPDNPISDPDYAQYRCKFLQCRLALKKGDTAGARSYVEEIKNLPGSSAQIPARLFSTASALESGNLPADANILYQRIITEYADSPYAGPDYAAFA
jgi:TolA-binding protein